MNNQLFIDNVDNSTPERGLWAAILFSFLEDVENADSKSVMEELLCHIDHDYTELMCDMAGVDHEIFVSHIKKVALKRITFLNTN